MLFLYHCFYTGIPYIKEFNLIIINDVNEKDFFININHFKAIKNIIFINFINKRTIKIAFNRAIIISLVILKLKIITRRKKIKLLGLLQRFEISIISKWNKRFLKKVKKARKAEKMS